MSIVSLSKVSHSFGIKEIFREIDFSLEHNSRIGLVGKNGSGKTTLFNLIIGNLKPEEGKVYLSQKAHISYLTQEPNLEEKRTLYACVLASRQDFIKLENKLRKAEQELAEQKITLEEFSRIQQQFELIDGYDFRTKMKLILTSLNFPENVWQREIKNFSGGEKTRIQLAKILLQPFDLLLLDEPTNHLDIEMIFWLENYLKNKEKPYLIISHDRAFLDRTVDKIVEIRNCKLEFYSGNYSFYLQEKEKRQELQRKQFKQQQKKIKKIREQIEQYRIWGRARDSEKMFKRAKELEKRLEKIEPIENPQKEKNINLDFQMRDRSGNDVFRLEKMKFGFPEKTLAENVNLNIFYQDRIAILGKNGCGKTTFLQLLKAEQKPLSGIAKKGASLEIGYYDQMHLQLDEDLTVKETIWQLVPLESNFHVLSYLAKFGFREDDVERQVKSLSGGEKARLYLAKLIHSQPNFLILDEPTNHLDLDMIESLEQSLLKFTGTIVFVSHDRYFIEKIANRKWIFRQKTIEETEKKLDQLFFQKKTVKKNPDNRIFRQREKTINPLLIAEIETKIERKQITLSQKSEKLSILEMNFSKPEFYENQNKLKNLAEQIKNLKNEVKTAANQLDEMEEEYLKMVE